MGAGAAIGGGLGLIGGISNMISGAKQASDAKQALEDYERQKLTNIAEGLQVSTLGADLQREEQARLASAQIGASREAGTRGIIGSLGKIEAGNQQVSREIGANLDLQQKQIEQMQAEDEARIRSMQENREIADINALSSQYNAGQQAKSNGFSQIAQAGSMIGNSFGQGTTGDASTSNGGTYSVSGVPLNSIDATSQSPSIGQYNNVDYSLQSGYATPPILTNPSYNPMNYGPQNSVNPFTLRNPLVNPYKPTKR